MEEQVTEEVKEQGNAREPMASQKKPSCAQVFALSAKELYQMANSEKYFIIEIAKINDPNFKWTDTLKKGEYTSHISIYKSDKILKMLSDPKASVLNGFDHNNYNAETGEYMISVGACTSMDEAMVFIKNLMSIESRKGIITLIHRSEVTSVEV